MPLSRRHLFALPVAALTGGVGRASAQSEGWYPIRTDDGTPVPNLRLPIELTSEVDELPGLIRVGPAGADVTLVEFYDYNCPYCRKAAHDLEALLGADRGVRLGLVNNPILSPQSKDAARIELAVLKLGGARAAYDFHKRLYRRAGRIDAGKALATAADLGLAREETTRRAEEPDVVEALERQLGLAASLGFAATPSFLIAGAGVLGYPGAKSIAAMIASVRTCDQIACT